LATVQVKLPAFDLVGHHGGLGVGVLQADRTGDWKVARRMHARARVESLAPAEFGDGAPMRQILTLALAILGKRVALRRLALGEP
jgi:hypothetical protein